MLKSACVQTGGRQLLVSGLQLEFDLPIDTKLGVWVAYVKIKLGVATHVSRSRSWLLK